MGRTLSAKQVLTIKRRTIRLGGIWDDCVGEIDRTGVVFFWVTAATERLRLWYPFARRCALMAKYFICRWRRDWEERHRMLFGVIGQMNAAVVFSTTIR